MVDRCTPGPRVLVLTAPVDHTADAVIQHLKRQGVSMARFDAAQFPAEISFTARLDDSQGWHAHLGGICLNELESIYYRRPRRFVFAPEIPDDILNWCDGQARFGFWGVLESLHARWVNPPSRVAQAEYKPRQLQLARQAGMNVPPTLITNCHGDVAPFAADNGGPIVTKALYARMPRDSRGYPSGVVYTAEVPPDRYSDVGIATTAHLFQTKISRDYDVRLTAVGNQLFAAALPESRTTASWTGARTTGKSAIRAARSRPPSSVVCSGSWGCWVWHSARWTLSSRRMADGSS